MPSISAIIVLYNSGERALGCIAALMQSQGVTLEIIAVDNASTDDTAARIRQNFPSVKLIYSAENVGFGGGCNLGAAEATGDLIALINPDLRVAPDALAILAAALPSESEAIVGPRTFDEDGALEITARPPYAIPGIIAKYFMLDKLDVRLAYGDAVRVCQQATEPTPVGWLQGSCLLMPATLYRRLGGFDERIFLYVEDADLGMRARDLGASSIYVPAAQVTHAGGTSTARFPLIRVRGYHLSPLIYYRNRGRSGAVRLLKAVFTLELLIKIAARTFSRSEMQQSQRRAELQVLGEMLRY
jgi:GT2 family glycosyltransferase